MLVAAAPVLRRLLGRLHQAGSDQLGPLFAELDALKRLAGAGQVGLLDQALSRGDVRASDAASPAGWVRAVRSVLPGRWRRGAGQGGRGGRPARNGLLAEAVLTARVPVGNAAVALGRWTSCCRG